MRKRAVLLTAVLACAGAGPTRAGDVALEAGTWRFHPAASRVPGQARLEEHLGRRTLFVQSGDVTFDVPPFADGSVQVDVAVPRARNFAGILFRVVSDGQHEDVYIRPHKSGLEDALQYHAVFDGSSTWQLYSGPGYTGVVEIPKEQWCPFKVVFKGLEAQVYFGDLEKPALVVPELKRGHARGGIGLWASAAGAWFSNLRYEPGPEVPPAPKPQPSLHPGIVRSWEISPAFDAEGALPEAVPAIDKWQRVGVEPPGLLVIDRYRKSTGMLPPSFDFSQRLGQAKGRRIVYARALLESDRAQVKRMSFGYSDEISVFVNGRLLFTGRSPFRFRDPTFLGIMDVEGDALYVPLERGRNEIVLAVAEFFGGWGVIARFDDPTGIRLP